MTPTLSKAISGIRLALLGILLVATLVTPTVGGAIGVYLGLAAALASLVVAFDREYLVQALKDWGVRTFLIAFIVLSSAFLLSAKTADDPMAFVDFLALPLIVPAYALAARHAGPGRIELISRLAALGCVFSLATALYQVHVLGLERAEGQTVSIFFADISVLLAFLCLLGLSVSHSRWRWAYYAGHAAGFAACMAGGSRGALLGYAVLYVCFAAYTLLKGQGAMRKRLLMLLFVPVFSLGLSQVLFNTDRVFSIVSVLGQVASTGKAESDNSATQRLAFWQGGVGAFMQSPIYGNGWWRRYDAAVPFMPKDGRDRTWSDDTSHLHNDVINFASAAGIMGVFAYLLLMSAPIISAWRSAMTPHRPIRLLSASGLSLGYLAFGLTDTMFVFEVPKSMFVLCAAVVMGLMMDPSAGTATGRRA